MSQKRQRHLFEEPGAGSSWLERPPLNPRPRLKEAIRQTLAACRFSRPQIAERMNLAFKAEGLANRVSVPRLDAWAADSKPNLPGVEELPVLCWAAESALPLAALNGCLRLRLISEEEGRLLELARTERQIKELVRRRRRQEIELEVE
ncbi:MAG: hypothetical protein ACLPYB_13485 [Desulfobaccales bacterium]